MFLFSCLKHVVNIISQHSSAYIPHQAHRQHEIDKCITMKCFSSKRSHTSNIKGSVTLHRATLNRATVKR